MIRKTIDAVNHELAGLPAEPGGVRRVVNLANWNSAGQVVISGEKGAVEEAARRLGVKTVFLPVSAPFHSELMLPAEEKLALDLDRVAFADPRFPVINNWQAQQGDERGRGRPRRIEEAGLPSGALAGDHGGRCWPIRPSPTMPRSGAARCWPGCSSAPPGTGSGEVHDPEYRKPGRY